MKDKWIFVGHLYPGQTSLMRMNALKRCGVCVKGYDTRAPWIAQSFLQRTLASRFERGRAIRKINEGLLKTANDVKPDYIWFDKQEYIRPETLEELKKGGAALVYYTPDPYFSLEWKRTRSMDACLPMFDLLVTSKSYEFAQFSAVGPKCLYLPLGYCDETHKPTPVPSTDKVCLGFVGGWEPRRQAVIESIAAQGVTVKIWGYAWDHLIDGRWTMRRYARLRRLAQGDPWRIGRSSVLASSIVPGEVYSSAYARALCTSRISLGFLRTICPDQHTTRSFEIPACGSMMLADRTDEHQAFFDEDKEAVYFASGEELVEKAMYFAKHETVREKIAAAGHERCLRSGYSYVDRMRTILGALV